MKTETKFEFFPEFDKESNNKLISQIFKKDRNPMDLLIWASKCNKNDK